MYYLLSLGSRMVTGKPMAKVALVTIQQVVGPLEHLPFFLICLRMATINLTSQQMSLISRFVQMNRLFVFQFQRKNPTSP
jgi:hypothetical protein